MDICFLVETTPRKWLMLRPRYSVPAPDLFPTLAAFLLHGGFGRSCNLLQNHENRLWQMQQESALCSLGDRLTFLYGAATYATSLGNSSTVEHRTLTPRI